jgi:hypothetical protein
MLAGTSSNNHAHSKNHRSNPRQNLTYRDPVDREDEQHHEVERPALQRPDQRHDHDREELVVCGRKGEGQEQEIQADRAERDECGGEGLAVSALREQGASEARNKSHTDEATSTDTEQNTRLTDGKGNRFRLVEVLAHAARGEAHDRAKDEDQALTTQQRG